MECAWNCPKHKASLLDVGICPFSDVGRARYEMDASILPLHRPEFLGGPQYSHLLGCISWYLGPRTYMHLRFMPVRKRLKRVIAYVEAVACLDCVDLRLVDCYGRSGLLRIAELHVEDDPEGTRKASAAAHQILASLVRSHGYTQAEIDAAKAQASCTEDIDAVVDVAACFYPHRPVRLRWLRTLIARRRVSEDALNIVLRAFAADFNLIPLNVLDESIRTLMNDAGVRAWDPSLIEGDAHMLFDELQRVDSRRRLAAAMALHPRLGAGSGWGRLGADLLRMCMDLALVWPPSVWCQA